MTQPKEPATVPDPVTTWNQHYPIGTLVLVRRDDGSVFRTTTKGAAEMLSGHTPVIWLEGVRGCYALDRVSPDCLPSPAPEPTPEALLVEFEIAYSTHVAMHTPDTELRYQRAASAIRARLCRPSPSSAPEGIERAIKAFEDALILDDFNTPTVGSVAAARDSLRDAISRAIEVARGSR